MTSEPGAALLDSGGPLTERHDVALLDLDGVVYLGATAVAGAADALATARQRGLRLAFVTNNASRTPEAIAEHLRALGFDADPDDVVTSALAAAGVVADRFATGVRVLVVGGVGLRSALRDRGAALVDSADDRPDVVVQGWAPEISYGDLAEAALAVGRGAWWLATNRDRTLPTARGIQPGNGALIGAVEAAVGHPPDAFAGKPDSALLREALRRTGARAPVLVGDRIDTDIEGAARVGIPSLCVLTGVSSGADIAEAAPGSRPSYVGLDLSALLQSHTAPRPDEGATRAGEWTVVAGDDGDLQVTGEGDPVQLLRAVSTAAWCAQPARPRLAVADEALPAVHAARLDGLLGAPRRPVG